MAEVEKQKFDILYSQWKESVVRFHLLKQEDAISKLLVRLNSQEFVNPPSRISIFRRLKEEQLSVFNTRMELLRQLEETKIPHLSKQYVSTVDDNLK